MKYMGLVTSCVAAATLSCCLSAHAQLDQLKKWGKKAADKATQPKDSNANDNKPAADSSTGTTTSTSSAPAASSSAAPTTTTAANSPSINGQPDLKAAKIEFVPGEKTMFMDDFSDMAADEPPPHWRVRNGAIELRTGGNLRQLTMNCPGSIELHSGSFSLPKNFTIEIEAANGSEYADQHWLVYPKDVDGGQAPLWEINISNGQVSMHGPKSDTIGSYDLEPKAQPGQPIKVALWVQNGRARGYVNGQRFADVNQMFVPADEKPADHFTLRERCDRASDGYIGVRSVRVAESTPDFYTSITGSGKYVTHGILFDTDSDHLKPESAAVITQVARGLDKNPAMKLEINGYTDAVGNDAHNQDLSQRRAEAVKTVLVQQFNVDGSRLSTKGYGAASPVASNDTAQGRADNRRVEFVKQ